MRQVRFIFIATLTSLLVPNAAFLRLDSFSNQGEIANAATPPAKQIDLTGTWIGKGTKVTFDQRGCTAGYAGQITADGQDTDKGAEITVTQRGNQLIIPPQKITYSGGSSGSYTQESQGTVSGNRFKLTTSANPSFGSFTVESTGTVSNDGNTINGEIFCKFSGGPATAKGTFTWTRLQPPNVDLTDTWISTGTIFTIDRRGCNAGYTGTFLINGKESQGFVFPLTQSGNQWTPPPCNNN